MDAILDAVLARYPVEARPRGKLLALGNAGGLSGARLWRFSALRGPLVLRAWPEQGPSRADVERVHRWLARAARLPFVPVPIADREGRTVVEASGRLWELAPWLPGSPATAGSPTPARIRAACSALAAFHEVFAEERRAGPSPNLAARLEELEKLQSGGFDHLEEALARAGDDPAVPIGRRWLALARRLAPSVGEELRHQLAHEVPLQPCLRDARPEHFLFEGERLTGLVDYGAMGIECVTSDLARLLLEWLEDPASWALGINAYETVRRLDPAEDRLIGPFTRSAALLGPGRWVRWRFVEERPFERPEVVVERLARGQDLLARLAASGFIR